MHQISETDFGDLHQSLLARATNFVRVARALLHGNGGEEDSRNCKIISIISQQDDFVILTSVFALSIVEVADIRSAGRERTVLLRDGIGKLLRDNLVDGEVGGSPAGTLNSTVEPFLASVGTSGSSELL